MYYTVIIAHLIFIDFLIIYMFAIFLNDCSIIIIIIHIKIIITTHIKFMMQTLTKQFTLIHVNVNAITISLINKYRRHLLLSFKLNVNAFALISTLMTIVLFKNLLTQYLFSIN